MDIIKPLKTVSFQPEYNEFILSVNDDIRGLNVLITDYEKASSAEKLEILFEINKYYKQITDRYSSREVARSQDFRKKFQEEIFGVLKNEFQNLKPNPCNSLCQATLTEFEIKHVNADNDENAQMLLTRLLQDPDSSEFKEYPEGIKKFIKNMAAEANPLQRHKDLVQLKNLIRTCITEGGVTSNLKKSLRSLVLATNSNIQTLIAANEELHVKKIPSTFPDFIANMSPDKVQLLTKILEGSSHLVAFNLNEALKKIYQIKIDGNPPQYKDEDTKEAKTFKDLLGTHTINFLGGGNSTNYLITHKKSNFQMVLKADDRLDAPKSLESHLNATLSGTVLTEIYADRTTCIEIKEDMKDIPVGRGLLVVEYCSGCNIESYRKKLESDPQTASKAQIIRAGIGIYKQMANILMDMTKNGAVFPDIKNTNWLIDENKQIRIADTKSFFPIDEEGRIRQERTIDGKLVSANPAAKWFPMLAYTPGLNPKELFDDKVSADKVHAYMLGMSICQFITGCSVKELTHEFNFELYRIFDSTEGIALQALIESLVSKDPDKRPSVLEALEGLKKIELMNLRTSCIELLKLVADPEKSDYQAKLDNVADDGLETLFLEIEGIGRRDDLRAECLVLVKELVGMGMKNDLMNVKQEEKWNKTIKDATSVLKLDEYKESLKGTIAALKDMKKEEVEDKEYVKSNGLGASSAANTDTRGIFRKFKDKVFTERKADDTLGANKETDGFKLGK